MCLYIRQGRRKDIIINKPKSTDLLHVSGKQSSKAPPPATVATSQDGSVTLRLVRQPETQHRAR